MHSLLCLMTVCSAAIMSGDSIRVYFRPDTSASVFGAITPGETVEVTVRTHDGWLGFDPGTAQAGNTGSFRYRWIAPDGAMVDTTGIPVVWAPEPGITYVMIMGDTPVREEPDSSADITGVLHSGEAAEVLEEAGEWFRITAADPPDPCWKPGWITLENAGLSGM